MRVMKGTKAQQERKQEKRAGRQMAMIGWNEAASGSRHTAEFEQRNMPLGIGHHMARSFKGHV